MTEKHYLVLEITGGLANIYDNTETWTFTMKPPCRYYQCANCPYRRGYMCCYEELKE